MCHDTYSLLSKAFQSNKLTLSSALDELDASLGSLAQLCTYGHTLTKFVAEFDDSSNPSSFRGIDITGGRGNLMQQESHYALSLLNQKNILKGTLKLMEFFKTLISLTLPIGQASGSERGIIAEYGLEEITHILQHYQLLFLQELHWQILHQWLQLKLHVCKKLPLTETS